MTADSNRPLVCGLLLAVGAAAVIAGCWLFLKPAKIPVEETADESVADVVRAPSAIAEVEPATTAAGAAEADASEPTAAEDAEEPLTDEERAEAEAAKCADAFDELTDKWMFPSEKGVTMADVDAFVKQFEAVPKDRKEECLQRALNLIPDENVMLLAGVLMDKTQDKELVELVFNDILNRDENVKKPIMQQIFQDKTHPCWADTAWILDVTGEK